MKRVFYFSAILLALSSATFSQAQEKSTRPLIVCSTTQVADFARQVVGDECQVHCILAPGQDPHLYRIKPRDAKLVARADLCLENGWHLEGKDWMHTLAVDAGKPIVSCTQGAIPLELDADGTEVRDPHAWFSPKNAAVYVRNITQAVSKIDPENSELYAARAELYLNQLRTLHLWIAKQCNAVPANKRILVTSHDAFNYYCRDYGFRSAAPVGWSTDQEVGGGITPAKRRKTVESIRSFNVKAVFVETSLNPAIIREIARDAGVKIGGQLYSDSMGGPGSAGETYIGMMRENTLIIVTALK